MKPSGYDLQNVLGSWGMEAGPHRIDAPDSGDKCQGQCGIRSDELPVADLTTKLAVHYELSRVVKVVDTVMLRSLSCPI